MPLPAEKGFRGYSGVEIGRQQTELKNSFPSEGADEWQKKPQDMAWWEFKTGLRMMEVKTRSSPPPHTSAGCR